MMTILVNSSRTRFLLCPGEISLTESTELKVISRVNQRFKECLRPVEPGSESDVGVIPGDGGGACGMDSSQFM